MANITSGHAPQQGTDNAALASVLGALDAAASADDPTSGDTGMAYLKQIINILEGTDGIAGWTAAAAPGAGVSLHEVLRQVYDDVTTILGMATTRLAHVRKTVTFSDSSGTVNVFTITGRVFVSALTAFCTTNVVEDGAVASISLGGATDAQAFIVNTNPDDISINEWWADATPVGGTKQLDALQIDVVTDEDVILTITGGTDLDSGVIVFDVWYIPVTDNGALAAAA